MRQTSKFFALFYGLIAAIVAALFLAGIALGEASSIDPITLLLFPIVYAGIIWIVTAILAWLYNEVASHVGGVEFDVRDV